MMDPNNLHKQTDCFLENEASAQCPSPPQVETLELQGQQNGVSESQINRGYAVCLDKTQKKRRAHIQLQHFLIEITKSQNLANGRMERTLHIQLPLRMPEE